MSSPPKKINGHKSVVADDTPLLTPALIRQLEMELTADKRQLAELSERIAKNEQKLAAARLFMPLDSAPAPAPTVERAVPAAKPVMVKVRSDTVPAKRKTFRRFKDSPNWAQMVYEALDAANRGLATKELREAITGSPLRDRESRGDRNLYQAIQRLLRFGDIAQHGGLLYSRRVYEELQARGEQLPDLTTDVRKPRGSRQIALTILSEHPEGLSLQQLRDAVRQVPDAPQSIHEHHQYIYNILAPLLGRGDVIKDGEVYRLSASAKG